MSILKFFFILHILYPSGILVEGSLVWFPELILSSYMSVYLWIVRDHEEGQRIPGLNVLKRTLMSLAENFKVYSNL